MEIDGEDLDGLFEEHENNEDRTDEVENNETAHETTDRTKVPAPKRIVKNPRLKFNPERLCGERGIPVVVDHFKNVQFKGKGYEKEDLDKLLSTLEHWTHRLFPSMKFDECLHHIEKLGRKRPVQTCLQKIRMDMPILNSDFVKDDDDDDDVLRNDDPDPTPVDAFDRLLGESQDILNISTPVNGDETNFMNSSSPSNNSQGHVLGSSFASSLTEEQKERMERNRLLAAERRKAKLAAAEIQTLDSPIANNPIYSEDISIVHDSVYKLDSSNFEQNNVPENESTVLAAEKDNCSTESRKGSSAEIVDQNSQHLGLDDLIDLVDEDESSDKNYTEVAIEQNEIHAYD